MVLIRYRYLLALAIAFAGLAAPANALAATNLYVAPTAHPPGDCLSPATACTLTTAVTTSVDGDTIFVTGAEGDYNFGATNVVEDSVAAIVGVNGRPRLIFTTGAFALASGGNTSANNLYVQSTSTNFAFGINDGGSANNLIVKATGAGASACFVRNATMTNSVCWVTGGGGSGYETQSNLGPITNTLRNVTAIAEGTDSDAVTVGAFNGNANNTSLVNVIAQRGTGVFAYDISATSDTLAGSISTVTTSYSDYSITDPATNNSFTIINDDGTKVTDPPIFVNAAAGDFHQSAASPTRDAGIDNAANGTLDFDGQDRSQGPRTDIGADEFAVAIPPGGGGGGGGGTTPVDNVSPALAGATITNKVFAVDPKGQVAQKRKRKRAVKRGTTFRFTLSEAATVRFLVERRTTGRKVGKRCRARTRKNRKRRRCTRYVRVRSFDRQGSAGANSIPFSGRVRIRGRARALKPGSYRMSLRGIDAGGKTSKLARVKFRIVKG